MSASQFAIFPKSFRTALQLVQQAAFRFEHGVIPVAEGVLFETEGATMRLTATNLTTSLSTTVPLVGNSLGTASGVVAPVMLAELLSTLPAKQEARFRYESDDNTLELVGAKGRYRHGCDNAVDFPRPKAINSFGDRATMPVASFLKALQLVLPSVATAARTPIVAFTAVSLRLRGQKAILQSTNGTAATSTEVHQCETTAPATLLLPLASMRLLASLLSNTVPTSEIVLNWNESSAEFGFGHPLVRLSTQLVDDVMPEIDNFLLPDPARQSVVLHRSELQLALLRLKLYTKAKATISFSPDKLHLHCAYPEWSYEGTEWLPAQTPDALPASVDVNLRFLEKLVAALDTEQIELSISPVAGGMLRLLPGAEAKAPFIYNTMMTLATILEKETESEEAVAEEEETFERP